METLNSVLVLYFEKTGKPITPTELMHLLIKEAYEAGKNEGSFGGTYISAEEWLRQYISTL